MGRSFDESFIIQRIKEGDKEAFSHIIDRYGQKVFQTSIGFVRDISEAEDLVQDIFIKVYEKLDKFKGESAFSTWLYRIAVNMAINRSRKLKMRSFFSSVEGSEVLLNEVYRSVGNDTIIEEKEKRAIIQKAIEKLTLMQRKVFVLSYYQDMANSEVAEVLGITVKAVESLLFRARKRLQEQLKKVEF
ncbi:RNA polymerase sigma factor [Marinilabiliaceae bacterium ANBcel2]|nr:RNA polymerase sigma factor [Marinilabiliaceae bacterium ANBcel2]